MPMNYDNDGFSMVDDPFNKDPFEIDPFSDSFCGGQHFNGQENVDGEYNGEQEECEFPVVEFMPSETGDKGKVVVGRHDRRGPRVQEQHRHRRRSSGIRHHEHEEVERHQGGRRQERRPSTENGPSRGIRSASSSDGISRELTRRASSRRCSIQGPKPSTTNTSTASVDPSSPQYHRAAPDSRGMGRSQSDDQCTAGRTGMGRRARRASIANCMEGSSGRNAQVEFHQPRPRTPDGMEEDHHNRSQRRESRHGTRPSRRRSSLVRSNSVAQMGGNSSDLVASPGECLGGRGSPGAEEKEDSPVLNRRRRSSLGRSRRRG